MKPPLNTRPKINSGLMSLPENVQNKLGRTFNVQSENDFSEVRERDTESTLKEKTVQKLRKEKGLAAKSSIMEAIKNMNDQ